MPEQPDNLFGGKLFTECTVLEQFSYSLHGLLFVSSNTAETKKLVLCCEIVSPPPPFLFFIFYFILWKQWWCWSGQWCGSTCWVTWTGGTRWRTGTGRTGRSPTPTTLHRGRVSQRDDVLHKSTVPRVQALDVDNRKTTVYWARIYFL